MDPDPTPEELEKRRKEKVEKELAEEVEKVKKEYAEKQKKKEEKEKDKDKKEDDDEKKKEKEKIQEGDKDKLPNVEETAPEAKKTDEPRIFRLHTYGLRYFLFFISLCSANLSLIGLYSIRGFDASGSSRLRN